MPEYTKPTIRPEYASHGRCEWRWTVDGSQCRDDSDGLDVLCIAHRAARNREVLAYMKEVTP